MAEGDEKEQLLCCMLIEKVVRSVFIPLSNLSKRSLFPYTLFALGRWPLFGPREIKETLSVRNSLSYCPFLRSFRKGDRGFFVVVCFFGLCWLEEIFPSR